MTDLGAQSQIHVVYYTTLFLLVGLLLLATSLAIFQAFVRRSLTLGALFIGLKQKVFMTTFLGAFFFGLYVFIVLLFSYILSAEMRQAFFTALHKHPIFFSYLGLVLFVVISLTILVVRSVIKRFYNSR